MGSFYLPTTIVTGPGCFQELGQHAARHAVNDTAGRRALLVCGAHSLRASGQFDRALGLLRGAGVQTTVYDAVSGEPTLDVVQAGLEQARANAAGLIIGIGGGSAMDVAKAIAGLFAHPGRVHDYFAGQRPIEGGGLPWIAVPTTAGTGAEVTKNAVLCDPAQHKKDSLRHDDWFARLTLVDPELTLSLPPGATAASGSDALTQAIESYTSIGANPITDALAIQAITRIGRALEQACRDGHDLDARADMLYGSLLAGMALTNARLGGVHGLAHPLGERYHIPHGVVCGLLLPTTMAYNIDYATGKYAHVAALLGIDTAGMDAHAAAGQAIEWIRALFGRIGIPARLAPFGLRRAHFATIIAKALPSGSLKHNPRPLSAHDVEAILDAAL
ncbi:MAG: iron-containing alcohol dehydrogenase [Anaerolineae bacterium]|nr:iron-containing alcohol dehydrogenase [Anaerolineae bacterium]